MNSLNLLRISALQLSRQPFQPSLNTPIKRFRKPSPCDVCMFPPQKRPCFDHRNLIIERGNQSHAKLIRSFLYAHYWPREPSVVGLWMPLNCPYLDVLTEKYSYSGDRFLAFEIIQRTGEKKLIGVSIANKMFPWMVDELEEWAHYTASRPERNRMYFCAHCLRSPNFYAKYNIDYIYDRVQPVDFLSPKVVTAPNAAAVAAVNYTYTLTAVAAATPNAVTTFGLREWTCKIEILGTAAEVSGQGVATQLLRTLLAHAEEVRHPLVQVVSVSQYTSKICERCGMKREWSMNYTDFVDDAGQRVFFPRRPHHTVGVYVKHFDPTLGGKEPCKPPFL